MEKYINIYTYRVKTAFQLFEEYVNSEDDTEIFFPNESIYYNWLYVHGWREYWENEQ